jgi:large subunit ribosomal protein L21
MFAVVKTGGKQYRVAANDVLTVEKLPAEAGETVEFSEILMLGGDEPKVGAPFVDGAAVKAEVLEQLRGPKVISFKKRRRKHSSQRKRGHRQYLTRVRIVDILSGGASVAKAEAEVPVAAEAQVTAEAPQPAAEPAPAIGLKEQTRWHTRRQAVRPVTAATPRAGGSV